MQTTKLSSLYLADIANDNSNCRFTKYSDLEVGHQSPLATTDRKFFLFLFALPTRFYCSVLSYFRCE